MFLHINSFCQKYFHVAVSVRFAFLLRMFIFSSSVSNTQEVLDRKELQIMDDIVNFFEAMTEQRNSSFHCHELDQGSFLLC